MEKLAIDLLKEYRDIVAEASKKKVKESWNNESPVFNSVMRRIEHSYPDLFTQYGYDVVEDAVRDQASFVGDVEEIGTSDVSHWTRQVIDTLKRDEMGAGIS